MNVTHRNVVCNLQLQRYTCLVVYMNVAVWGALRLLPKFVVLFVKRTVECIAQLVVDHFA